MRRMTSIWLGLRGAGQHRGGPIDHWKDLVNRIHFLYMKKELEICSFFGGISTRLFDQRTEQLPDEVFSAIRVPRQEADDERDNIKMEFAADCFSTFLASQLV